MMRVEITERLKNGADPAEVAAAEARVAAAQSTLNMAFHCRAVRWNCHTG